jgi:hypothetical protein
MKRTSYSMADFYKNTNIEGNRLSNLDPGQVLMDSHNVEEHALEVININSLVPKAFNSIEMDYNSNGDIQFVYYFGKGSYRVESLTLPQYPKGKYQISTVSFTGITPVELDEKYLLITAYNSSHTVVELILVWFNLNGTGMTPMVPSDRAIEVPIVSSDSDIEILDKFNYYLDLNISTLNISKLGATSILQHDYLKSFNPLNSGDSGLIVGTIQGSESLNGDYFTLIDSFSNITRGFIFVIEGETDYSNTQPTFTEINILQSMLDQDILNAIYNELESESITFDLSSSSIKLTSGVSLDEAMLNVSNSALSVAVFKSGVQDMKICTLELFYNVNGDIIQVKRANQ